MNSKKIIEKLIKVAQNQQKIINKLAQVQTDLKDVCQNILTKLAPGYQVIQIDRAGDKVKITVDPKLQDPILNAFKEAVAVHSGATEVIVA